MEWKEEFKGQVIKTKVNTIPVTIDTTTEDVCYWSQYPELSEFITMKKATKEFIEEKVEVVKPKTTRKKKGV